MNARQRLFAALNREPVDRVPIWLLFPYHPIGCYVDVRTHPQWRRVFDASRGTCIMLDRRNLDIPFFAPEVVERQERTRLPDGTVEDRLTVEWQGRSLVSWQRSGPAGTQVKKLLESEEDLAFFAALPVLADRAALSRELDRLLPEYLREKAEFPAEHGAMMLDLGDPITILYGRSKLEEYAIWSLTCPELVESVLRKLQERFVNLYHLTLERDLADLYFLVGSELASPPLVSVETFRRWVVPFETELIDLVHAHGKKVILHYHGQIKEVLPDILAMAPDALHTIEAPPIGNCTLPEAFQITHDRLTLIGNIQYDDFRSSTPEQMRAAVAQVLAEAKGHPFILSPSAGPYDPEPGEAMIENYLAFIQAGWELGAQQQ
ncbi:MAG: uroporphyrinogen decarboxylase family protein [Lentisphaeria bacterium]|jgi:hypothetical protein